MLKLLRWNAAVENYPQSVKEGICRCAQYQKWVFAEFSIRNWPYSYAYLHGRYPLMDVRHFAINSQTSPSLSFHDLIEYLGMSHNNNEESLYYLKCPSILTHCNLKLSEFHALLVGIRMTITGILIHLGIQSNHDSSKIHSSKYPDTSNWPCSPGETPIL